MAYTGTGTQADPYVVTTYSELIAALQAAQAVGQVFYLKVANDINCADDPNYTGVLTTPLYMTAGTIYADSLVTIEGLTISASSFAVSGGSNYAANVENIYFKNCVYKATASGSSFAVSNDKGYNFTNCKFSMILNLGSYSSSYVFRYTTATDCAGYFKIMNNDRSCSFGQMTSSGRNTFTRCNFIVDSLKFNEYGTQYTGIWGTGFNAAQASLTNSSIIFKNCDISNTGSSTINITPEGLATMIDASYIAFVNCTFASNITTLNGTAAGSTGILSICATDDPNLTLTTGNPATMIATTVENLRDKEYLISIGFLP